MPAQRRPIRREVRANLSCCEGPLWPAHGECKLCVYSQILALIAQNKVSNGTGVRKSIMQATIQQRTVLAAENEPLRPSAVKKRLFNAENAESFAEGRRGKSNQSCRRLRSPNMRVNDFLKKLFP